MFWQLAVVVHDVLHSIVTSMPKFDGMCGQEHSLQVLCALSIIFRGYEILVWV